ncbi:MAG: hypothetical protein Q8K61_02370 [Gallionella sp.]|nr:hypothetical protein [Gallionella sp.]
MHNIKRSRRPALAWEICLALLLKIALLLLLWWAFFSHAPDKQTIANSVTERMSGTAQDASITSTGNNHD